MEVIVKSSPKIEIEFATKVVNVGGKVTVDSALSTESENPVMNKVVTEELNKKLEGEVVGTTSPTEGTVGGSYDDTEIREELAELSAEVSGLSEKVDELGQPIFKAVYGVTTYDEIKDAYEAGLVVHCDYNSNCYTLSAIHNDAIYFTFINQAISYRIRCGVDNSWSEQYYPLQYAGDRTNVINESSTNNQYPSAKAVYEAIEGVKGEVDDIEDSLEPLKLESFSYEFTSKDLLAGAVSPYGYIESFGTRTLPIDFKRGDIIKCVGFGGTPSYSLASQWKDGVFVKSLYTPSEGGAHDFTIEVERDMSIVFSTSSSAISISGKRSYIISILGQSGADKVWKKVFDGRMAVGESKISASTFADGTPLLAEEVVVQILMDSFEGVSENRQGYVGIHSSTNPNTDQYGALYFEKIGGTTPLLGMMRLKASPFIMVGEMIDCAPIAVAQGTQIQARAGKRGEVYEDICYVEVGPTIAIVTAPPLIKIYAR